MLYDGIDWIVFSVNDWFVKSSFIVCDFAIAVAMPCSVRYSNVQCETASTQPKCIHLRVTQWTTRRWWWTQWMCAYMANVRWTCNSFISITSCEFTFNDSFVPLQENSTRIFKLKNFKFNCKLIKMYFIFLIFLKLQSSKLKNQCPNNNRPHCAYFQSLIVFD